MAKVKARELPGGGKRYDVRWYDPDGARKRKTFTRKVDADKYAAKVEHEKNTGAYLDPELGKITFRKYAEEWISLAYDVEQYNTREAVEQRMKAHVYPVIGTYPIAKVTAKELRALAVKLRRTIGAGSTRQTIMANVSSILETAVDEDRIRRNYARSEAVRKALDGAATSAEDRAVWEAETVVAVREALPEKWRILVDLGVGLGLRQGEIFGLAVEDVDFLRGEVTLRRQIKLTSSNRTLFGPLKHRSERKGNSERKVPLPASVKHRLAAHLATYPARAVTLPYGHPGGGERTYNLILTTREGGALNRNYVNTHIWKKALRAAEVEESRGNGMHALRHRYGSVLLDAGVNIKAVADYLGHASADFTLRVYAHKLKAADERTAAAIDASFEDYGEQSEAI